MIGIYTIYCRVTNKHYIGSSIDVDFRLKFHISKLKKRQHKNKELQRDYDKHGHDSFEFKLLEECPEQRLIIREEYYYVKYYPCYSAARARKKFYSQDAMFSSNAFIRRQAKKYFH